MTDLFTATQWLHVDPKQTARALGLPVEKCASPCPAPVAKLPSPR